jgi:hypothetical protein
MALSIPILRNAKPRAKPYKLSDEKGLFLHIRMSLIVLAQRPSCHD